MAIIIGIDAGAENRTGYAIYCDESKEFLELASGNYKEVLQAVIAMQPACVVLENANADKNQAWLYPYFKTLSKQRTKHRDAEKSAFNRALKIAQDLGKNMQIATEIAEQLQAAGIPVAHISPRSRQRADKPHRGGRFVGIKGYTMPTKTNKKQFCQLTGYDGRSNEHARDAACMLVGRTLFYWTNYIKTQKL